MSVKNVSGANFQEVVLESEVPVVVDFWSVTCAPCKAISAILDDLAITYQGRLRIVKLCVDDDPDIATQYGVRGAPTLKFFVGGEARGTRTGAAPRSILSNWIAEQMSGSTNAKNRQVFGG